MNDTILGEDEGDMLSFVAVEVLKVDPKDFWCLSNLICVQMCTFLKCAAIT